MITKAELLLLERGQSYPILWDTSKIVEVLHRAKGKGVWRFYVHNIISGKYFRLRKEKEVFWFTIIPLNYEVTLDQLLPKDLKGKFNEKI